MTKNLVFEKLIKEFNSGFKAGSQTKFAKAMGVSPQLINYWVQGKTIPSPENMKQLSKVLKKSIGEIQNIFTGEEEAETKDKNNSKDKTNIDLMMNLIKENNKRFESEISLLKKEIEILKEKNKILEKNLK